MSYIVSAADTGRIVLSESDTVRSILQNIRIILATKQRTVPLYREFGIDTSFVDKPMPVAQALMIAEIKDAITQWEPRAELQSVDFAVDASSPDKLIPVVEVEINNGQ